MDYSYTEYMNYNRLDKQWTWNQYRLTPEPPKRDLQEFIKAYKETGDERQLLFYLHYAEPLINQKARKLCGHYHVENYFAEIKTVIIETLIEILPDYDGSVGTTFWQYAYLYIKGNVNVFIRNNCGALCLSHEDYKLLKKVNGNYYEFLCNCSHEESIRRTAEKLSISTDDVAWSVEAGENFRFFSSIEADATNEEGQESAAYQIPDPYPVPDSYLPLKMITDEIIKYILQLNYRDRVMFVLSIGMCDGCWNELPDKDKRTYGEIVYDFELRSPQAVSDNRRKVTEELRKILKKHEG